MSIGAGVLLDDLLDRPSAEMSAKQVDVDIIAPGAAVSLIRMMQKSLSFQL